MAGTEPLEPSAGRRFSLIRTLGEGSFGAVYLAEMEGAGGFKRRVALKLLHESWDPASDAGRRLRDEARLLGRLEHRHIVRVDDLVKLNGRWALVMEYVSGADLERVFAWAEATETPIPPRAVAEIGAAVAAALEAAYTAAGDDGEPLHVVHRDIKPSNVRLAENGEIKVLDFGVARAVFAGREAKTERVRYGSLGYMAPERLLGDAEGPPGDIYAVGVVIWELVTGKLYGRTELGYEQQEAQVRAAREVLVGVVGETPLVDIVVRSLAYDPVDRPSARELEDTLRAAATSLGGADATTFARATLQQLVTTPVDDVRGRILTESGGQTSGREARVSSATLMVDPLDLQGSVGLEAPVAAPVPPPAPARSPWPLVGAVGAIAGVLLAVVLLWPAAKPDVPVAPPVAPVVAAPQVPVEPVAPVAPPEVVASEPAPAPPENKTAVAATKPPRTTTVAKVDKPPAEVAPEKIATVVAPPSDSARLRAAKFTLTGAEGMRVVCGDVAASGTTSTLLRDFPAGTCTVSVAGKSTSVTLDAPRGVACTVEGDVLQCR